MSADLDRAAIKAIDTLIRCCVKTSPISPLPMLEQLKNVILVSFSDLSEPAGLPKRDILPLFGKNRDAVTSVLMEDDHPIYMVAYDSLLPFSMVQRALAREMGHIVLQHTGSSLDNTAEAMCFAHHLLCPRPLIHAIQATNLRLTADLLANLTGVFDQSVVSMRRTPGTSVPAGMNRFVRNQFMPFVLNFFEYYQSVLPFDGSALADLGTYMDGYEE